MKKIALVFLSMTLVWTAVTSAQPTAQKPTYPETTRGNTINNYFGTKVAAPYEWMENLESPTVKQWVDDENKLTFAYLDKIPQRDAVRQRLMQLWNYEKVGVPADAGRTLVFQQEHRLAESVSGFRAGWCWWQAAGIAGSQHPFAEW